MVLNDYELKAKDLIPIYSESKPLGPIDLMRDRGHREHIFHS